MAKNKHLLSAKIAKRDEFYTSYEEIELELKHYLPFLKDKIIYSNCDSQNSNFVKYFENNKELIGYKDFYYTYFDPETGEGSFDSENSKKLLELCDVVITNPPFSKFISFIDLLMKYNKKFLVIGDQNALSGRLISELASNGLIRSGFTKPKTFEIPYIPTQKNAKKLPNGNHLITLGSTCWFTNLPIKRSNIKKFTKTYKGNEADYPKYDGYNIIEVKKINDIPVEYDGIMGVPVTIHHIDNEFEIVGTSNNSTSIKKAVDGAYYGPLKLSGKEVYFRYLIQHKNIK